MFFNFGDCRVRCFVCPNGVIPFRSADGDAVVGAIALVRTIAIMRSPNEQRHVGIVARQVVNGRISLFFKPKCCHRFSHYPPRNRYTHLALGRKNCDGMVRPRKFYFFAFARLGMHCAPHIVRHSFEPPSTGMLAPVIQRAASDARNATTSATSSGLPIRFRACIPSATRRPPAVLVKLDMSVSITPGATAFTRIPWGPRMAAQFLTRVSNAPLVEA